MGKMLESLKRARERRGQGGQTPALHAVWPETKTEDETPEEDMPFIEVGGPRTPADAPVLKLAPPPAAAPKLMTVAFRPLPAEHASGNGLCAFAPELIAYHQPHHSLSGQYRVLVDGLLAALPAEQARVLLFSAAAAGVGTTTVLLNAAITLARQTEPASSWWTPTCDPPRRGQPSWTVGKTGTAQVLGGQLKLENALRTTGLPNLSLLAAGVPRPLRRCVWSARSCAVSCASAPALRSGVGGWAALGWPA